MSRRNIVLVQLPIPQPGMSPAKGNVPLAAGYLKMFAQNAGVGDAYQIDIFPPPLANTLSDAGLADAILCHEPWMVGFTCYLWNIDRTLYVAKLLKQRKPELRIIVGGPEITADNAWVLERAELDFAAIGEGEQTFVDLLNALRSHDWPTQPIDGLYIGAARNGRSGAGAKSFDLPLLGSSQQPKFRQPLPSLDPISSPYLCGILDAADEQMLLLETIRGCIFKCKFCYYPKSYDDLYFVSQDKIEANLAHARERGAKEVVILDPTLNQRKEFDDFVKLLARNNPGGQFNYFGELRAEGITTTTAKLLKEANFTEVEIGLQSIDPLAMELMDRKNNMKAFERGVRAMMDVGISVKIDLIIGLPGDTPDSIRRGFEYVHRTGLYSDIQVFNLAILPGTAFRQEAQQLGLRFQPRPPYYVLETPTLELTDFYQLMAEAEDLFEAEFDAHGAPELIPPGRDKNQLVRTIQIDLDAPVVDNPLPPPTERSQALTLWLKASNWKQHRKQICQWIEQLLGDNPHSTLQVILEPLAGVRDLTPNYLESIRQSCFASTSYLDRFYSILPDRTAGAKRVVILLPETHRQKLGDERVSELAAYTAIGWHTPKLEDEQDELAPNEYLLQYQPAATA